MYSKHDELNILIQLYIRLELQMLGTRPTVTIEYIFSVMFYCLYYCSTSDISLQTYTLT